MVRSLLGSLVRGTRTLLGVQLFIAVGLIALAGWTLAVTTEIARERDRLRERVIQLETSYAERGLVVPPAPTVVAATNVASAPIYPGSIADTSVAESTRNFGQVIGDLFAPAPPMRLVVLHVRAESDVTAAQELADVLQGQDGVDVTVNVVRASDQQQSGYWYFDGRQNRAAAALVTRLHDAARERGVAPWSAQLRGTALPAEGEYSADRLDIVLPPLPPPPAPPVEPLAATPGR